MAMKAKIISEDGEKSHVGMVICCICQKPMEILLDRRLKNSLPRNNMIPGRVCDKCEKTYLSQGILIMNPETGSMAVIKDAALKRIMNNIPESQKILEQAIKRRRCFAGEEIVQLFIEAGKEADAAIGDGEAAEVEKCSD